MIAAASMVALAALVGCSPDVEADASYDSIDALRDAAIASGLPCDEWKETSNKESIVTGTCDGVALLMVDTTGTPIKPEEHAMAVILTGYNSKQDPTMLYAENWVVGAPPSVASKIQKKMGGAEFPWYDLSGEELLEGLGGD